MALPLAALGGGLTVLGTEVRSHGFRSVNQRRLPCYYESCSNQLIFCVFRDLLALSILAPVAYVREKRVRLPKTRHLLVSFFFLGLTGIFGNQLLFLIGLGYTNPTYADAIQPSTPVFTFLFAAVMGKSDFSHIGRAGQNWRDSHLCFSSHIDDAESDFMYQSETSVRGQPEPGGWLVSSFLEFGLNQFHLGVLCLVGNCMCMAAIPAIQALILKRYPANLSVTAYSYLFGAILMVIPSLVVNNESADWNLTQSEVLAVLYAITCMLYNFSCYRNELKKYSHV